MLDPEIQELLLYALRIVFLLALPVVIVLSIAGTLVAAFQAATTLRESTVSYAIKLFALLALLYFTYPAFSRSLLSLAEMSWK